MLAHKKGKYLFYEISFKENNVRNRFFLERLGVSFPYMLFYVIITNCEIKYEIKFHLK